MSEEMKARVKKMFVRMNRQSYDIRAIDITMHLIVCNVFECLNRFKTSQYIISSNT